MVMLLSVMTVSELIPRVDLDCLIYVVRSCDPFFLIHAGSVEPGTISVLLEDSTNSNHNRLALKISSPHEAWLELA